MARWKEYYAGLSGYFQREDAAEWEEGDRGVERFYVYILEIDRPAGPVCGADKEPAATAEGSRGRYGEDDGRRGR